MTDITSLSEELPLGLAGGRSLPDAIRDKYLCDEPLSGMILGGVTISTNLKLVIKDSSSGDVRLPHWVSLNYCCIMGAGNQGEVERLCWNVRELDIAENNLSEWEEVLSIIRQIPKLQFLNLSSNPLNIAIQSELRPIVSLSNITTLVLNNTMIPWESLYVLLDNAPQLDKLHLSLNNYGTVSPTNHTYRTIHLLQFNRNNVTSWSEVIKLGKMFPSLQSLFLSENNIRGLTADVSEYFQNLQNICLNKTGMMSWDEVDALNTFVSLVKLRLSQCPLLDGYEEKERRRLVIARLTSQVRQLNGGKIGSTEREESERAFIRYYEDYDVKPQRYYDLVAVYGTLDPLVDVDLRPKTTASCIVRFEDKQKTFKLSTKLTCSQLKQKLQEFVGLPAGKFIILYWDTTLAFGPSAMNYPSKYLYSYQVKDGDEFIIHRKNIPKH